MRSHPGVAPVGPLSIRAHLTLAIVAVLVVTLILSGLVLVRATRATLIEEVDEDLISLATRAQGRMPPRNETGTSPGEDEVDLFGRPVAQLVFSPAGELVYLNPSGFSDDPDPLPSVPSVPRGELDAFLGRIMTVPSVDGAIDYRMLAQREPDGDIEITAAPLDEVDSAIDQLFRLLLLIGTFALVAAILMSWLLIRRGMQPVDRMVDTASAIAAGDMSRRVTDADPGTELGRLGGTLNEMLQQIEGALRAQSASEERLRRFVADAAHELRTPLTSLRGYAELYRQGALPDERSVTDAMQRIESEGARMAQLVNDLLLLARLDQQRGLEFEPVHIGAVVGDAVAAFQAVQPDRPVTEDLDNQAVVSGDRLRLRQIVDNLLANARVHTPAETPVHVALRRDADHVAIKVSDEGPGIAQEELEHIFDRFWRGGPSKLRSGSGTGLGLSIVASLVEAHGGTIDVASEPGHGTTFTVRLPLLDGPGEGA